MMMMIEEKRHMTVKHGVRRLSSAKNGLRKCSRSVQMRNDELCAINRRGQSYYAASERLLES